MASNMSVIAPKTPALKARPNMTAQSMWTFPFQDTQSVCCWSDLMGVSRYIAEMSKVAATQAWGRAKMIPEVLSKVPHSVGKSLALMPAFTEGNRGLLRGYDISCIIHNLRE